MAEELPLLLNVKFEALCRLFQDLSSICIVNSNTGEIAATYSPIGYLASDHSAAVSALHDSAMKLANTLSLTGCKVLRITGETRMFYCYEIESNSYILAFYAKVDHLYPVPAVTNSLPGSNNSSIASDGSSMERMNIGEGKRGRSQRANEKARERQTTQLTQRQVMERDARVWEIIESLRLLLVGTTSMVTSKPLIEE